jgi:hypothetical protein
MSPNTPWEEIERLYQEALELPVHEREAWLARAGPAPAIREEVESLLAADSRAGLVAPPVHLAADFLNRQPGALAAGDRVADYDVESLISVGGRGEVYRARDSAGIPVAR